MTGCPSTMTFGTGADWLDKWLSEHFGGPATWPVHRCEKTAGHEGDHSAGGMTWNPLTITVPITIPESVS